MIRQHIFYYFTGGRILLSRVRLPSLPHSCSLIFPLAYTLVRTFWLFTYPIFPLLPSRSLIHTCMTLTVLPFLHSLCLLHLNQPFPSSNNTFHLSRAHSEELIVLSLL